MAHILAGREHCYVSLDERLQRVKPLCYPPGNLIRGKLSFTGVVSVTLNFHPQGRNVNDVTNEGKAEKSEAGRPL